MFESSKIPLAALALAAALAACSKDEPKPEAAPPAKEAPAEGAPAEPKPEDPAAPAAEKTEPPAAPASEPAAPAKGGEEAGGETAQAEAPEAKSGDAPAEGTETATAEPKKTGKKKSADKAGDKAAEEPAKEAKPKFTELGVQVTKTGTGTAATAGKIVTLHYKASVADAEKPFDSTYAANRPLAIDLGLSAKLQVIEGLRRGLEGLTPGSEARLQIPAELAWGEKGNPSVGVPANADVVFEVQVLDVQ